jgi:hypothetical protein
MQIAWSLAVTLALAVAATGCGGSSAKPQPDAGTDASTTPDADPSCFLDQSFLDNCTL